MTTLLTILNNEEKSLEISEIFDSSKYNVLKAVTFSIDANFYNKYLENFEETTITVGIQDSEVQERALDSRKQAIHQLINSTKILNDGTPMRLIEELNSGLQEKITKNKFNIRIPIDKTIHSKVYLLENTQTKETRVIIGSANLSTQAFSNSTNQLEIVEIRDNDAIFEIYNEYYENTIVPATQNLFTKSVLDKLTKKKAKNPDLNINFTPEETSELRVNTISDFYDGIQKKVTIGEIKQELIEDLKGEQEFEQIRVEEFQQRANELGFALRITNSVVNRRTGNTANSDTKLLDKAKMRTNIKKYQQQQIQAKKVKSETAPRELIINKPALRTENNSGLSQGIKIESTINPETKALEEHFSYYQIGERLTDVEIKENIEIICKLLKNYEDFVPNYTPEYGKRVMETILYTFTSPFIGEIREKFTLGNEALDIPLFAIVGGTGGSGKSNLLNILNKMLGLTTDNKIPTYNELVDNDTRKDSATRQQIRYWMLNEDNVAPLLVDELPSDFFNGKGEDLIKDISNQAENQIHLTPAFICTTNAEAIGSKSEALSRRIYYLLNDRKFDSQRRAETTDRYIEVYEKINSGLFRDFVLRFSKKLMQDDLNWKHYSGNKLDFLYYTREIFKEYFEIAEIELPDFFPLSRVDDATKNNMLMWRKLYIGSPELFKEVKGEQEERNIYMIKMSELDHNFQSSRYGVDNTKPSKVYSEALENKVLSSSKTNADLFVEIFQDSFHEWINVPLKSDDKQENIIEEEKIQDVEEKVGFFQRLFGKNK